MAISLRTALNRVLTAIGEPLIPPTTTTIADPLQLKLLEFLNQFKEEIEDASYWRALRQTITVTVAANTNTAAIPGTDERARVVRVPEPQAGQLVPLVFDITDSNNPIPLFEVPLNEIQYLNAANAPLFATVQPDRFAMDVASGQVVLTVYPQPTSARTIVVYMHVPQQYMDPTTLDNPILMIPALPLMKGTIWYALMDRGEEMGANAMFTEERYRTSLDDAISRDTAEQGQMDQLVPDWFTPRPN